MDDSAGSKVTQQLMGADTFCLEIVSLVFMKELPLSTLLIVITSFKTGQIIIAASVSLHSSHRPNGYAITRRYVYNCRLRNNVATQMHMAWIIIG